MDYIYSMKQNKAVERIQSEIADYAGYVAALEVQVANALTSQNWSLLSELNNDLNIKVGHKIGLETALFYVNLYSE